MPVDVKTVKAGLLESSEEFVIKMIPLPAPDKDNVLVRVHACGVCMSEVSSWKTGPNQPDYPGYPQVLNVLDWGFSVRRSNRSYPVLWGHEITGEIVEVGGETSNLRPGMRITGFGSGAGYGGFAEYCLMPINYTVPLNTDIPSIYALGEPIACAYNAVKRAEVKPGESVAFVGCGFMGLLMLQIARLANPRVIVAMDIRDDILDVAKQLGADFTINVTHENFPATLKKALGSQGADVAIEAAGTQETISLAGRIAAIRGRVVIAGYYQGSECGVDMQNWNFKSLDIINAIERDPQVYCDGMRAGVRLLEEGKINMEKLVTHVLPLEDIGKAFRMAIEKPGGFIKAVIAPMDTLHGSD